MLRKVVLLSSALWLALVPALCSAGALVHPCDCLSEAIDCGPCCDAEAGTSEAGTSDELDCDCMDDGCSHDGCENDPCQVSVAPDREDAPWAVLVPAALILLPLFQLDAERLERAAIAYPSGPPDFRKELPYFLSDLPLRI